MGLTKHTQVRELDHRAALGDGLNVVHLEAPVAGVVGSHIIVKGDDE
ncbi:MAG TPA: hypothetical protein VF025_09460 [Gaiellaceae bacterium]